MQRPDEKRRVRKRDNRKSDSVRETNEKYASKKKERRSATSLPTRKTQTFEQKLKKF